MPWIAEIKHRPDGLTPQKGKTCRKLIRRVPHSLPLEKPATGETKDAVRIEQGGKTENRPCVNIYHFARNHNRIRVMGIRKSGIVVIALPGLKLAF